MLGLAMVYGKMIVAIVVSHSPWCNILCHVAVQVGLGYTSHYGYSVRTDCPAVDHCL